MPFIQLIDFQWLRIFAPDRDVRNRYNDRPRAGQYVSSWNSKTAQAPLNKKDNCASNLLAFLKFVMPSEPSLKSYNGTFLVPPEIWAGMYSAPVYGKGIC
jgi:hypothetical protein